MIKLENCEVYNFYRAIKGVRRSFDSQDKSDIVRDLKLNFAGLNSHELEELLDFDLGKGDTKAGTQLLEANGILHEGIKIGPNDYKLVMMLVRLANKTGQRSHVKFLRQIFLTVDITAPLYWWKEFDQYKVGTVTQSDSTMHTLHKKPITKDMFSFNPFFRSSEQQFNKYIEYLEHTRQAYLEAVERKDESKKLVWYELIQMLPSNFNQTRTTTMSYENLVNIYQSREGHRLFREWEPMREWVHKLPYSELITG